MKKFHIGKNGPAPCQATKGKCPLGGESGSDNHFNSEEDAMNAWTKKEGFENIPKNSLKNTSRGNNDNELTKNKKTSKIITSAELKYQNFKESVNKDFEKESMTAKFDNKYFEESYLDALKTSEVSFGEVKNKKELFKFIDVLEAQRAQSARTDRRPGLSEGYEKAQEIIGRNFNKLDARISAAEKRAAIERMFSKD